MFKDTTVEQNQRLAEAILTRMSEDATEGNLAWLTEILSEAIESNQNQVTNLLCAVFSLDCYDELIEWFDTVLEESELQDEY